MKRSDSLDKFAPAFLAAQRAMIPATKDSENPFFKSHYADFESCWSAVKGPLHDNGLMLIQTMGAHETMGPTLITTLLHQSGQFVEGEQPISPKSSNPQDIGSAQTYARRYGLVAITGLEQRDDDGQGQTNTEPKKVSQNATPSTDAAGRFKITFGKFNGKWMDEVPDKDLDNYASWLKNDAKTKGKSIDAWTQSFLDAVATRLMKNAGSLF